MHLPRDDREDTEPSRESERDHRGPRAASPARIPTIVVHAQNLSAVASTLAACNVQARCVPDLAALASLVRSPGCCIALVAVDGTSPRVQSAATAVALLVKKGFKVLCHHEGPLKWSVATQCSLLVAGAAHLLEVADPAFSRDLREWITRACSAEADAQDEERRLDAELRALGVAGRSAAIVEVFRWVLRASSLSALPVLISGETGTGKELVARAIHRLDPLRRNHPFVPVNCGAISAGLAESELFGHRRGAFTGAERDRKGLIRAALGGVLFLDEIADLDAVVQGKLLRVLQERRVLGVGEDREIAVDVRVVAATNRNLEAMVGDGAFRADLFHRLNVLSVRVPPLRERREDIAPLVRHFLAGCASAHGRQVSPTDDFLEALARIELPGNARQLENLVRRAYVTAGDDGRLRLNALPPELWRQLAPVSGTPSVERTRPVAEATPGGAEGCGREARMLRPVAEATPDGAEGCGREARMLDPVAVLEAHSWNLERSLDFCEHTIVSAALEMSRGNRSRAARMLGISPRSIFNKMRKHRVA